MANTIEVLKQMVEALEVDAYVYNGEKSWAAIRAGKQAIAELESLEPVAHSVISGALFDFMGWLTSRKERIVLSSADNASPAVEAITEFARMRNLSLDDAKVQDWHTHPPQRTEQEPVAWMRPSEEGYDSAFRDHRTVISCTGGNWIDWIPLYTPPQRTEGRVCCQQYDICLEPCTSRGRHLAQRTWVGLTDEEIDYIYTGIEAVHDEVDSDVLCRAIEAKLKDKNCL
jgi:hypothetical protein